MNAIPATTGVAVLSQSERQPGPQIIATEGATSMEYSTATDSYRVSAGAFFQVNRFLTDELVRIVTQSRSGGTALDLYAGVGLFSSVLSREFERVVAVESSPQSAADLGYNSPGNVKAVRSTVEEYVRKRDRGLRADLIVVDPPRGGLGTKLARALGEWQAPRLTYVSCDPASLARDLVPLLAAGYSVERIHLVDLFPQTFHLESVVELKKSSLATSC
jgi:23S rRNA (uracil1939-C5)-methyltransferase